MEPTQKCQFSMAFHDDKKYKYNSRCIRVQFYVLNKLSSKDI